MYLLDTSFLLSPPSLLFVLFAISSFFPFHIVLFYTSFTLALSFLPIGLHILLFPPSISFAHPYSPLSPLGIAAAPIILITVREPKRKKNPLSNKSDEVKLPFHLRVLLLIKTFLLPGMLTLCIAGGVRNAGGYVWAYNTELFFKKRGFDGDTINQFMSWIPLVAGSIGAVVGGIISDILVKGRGPYMRIWVLIVSQVSGWCYNVRSNRAWYMYTCKCLHNYTKY